MPRLSSHSSPVVPRATAPRPRVEQEVALLALRRLPLLLWLLLWFLAWVGLACSSGAPDSARTGHSGATGGASTGGASTGGASTGGAAASSSGGQSPTTSLRVASYNAHNFFNAELDAEPGITGEQSSTPSPEEYAQKLQAMAGLLNRMDADIVLFQEVENLATLKDLAGMKSLKRHYQHVRVIPGNDRRGIDVGVLSTLAFERVVSHKQETFQRLDAPDRHYRYARDALELQLTLNGQTLVLFNVHFRSKLFDDPDKRMAEAQHTRALADQLLKGDPKRGILIVGDFNDVPSSGPVQALYGVPAHCVCQGPAFKSTVQLLPSEGDRWTLFSQSQRKHFDDILISPVLYQLLQPGSPAVLHDSDLPAAQAALSDHAPVLATFLIPN